MLYLVFVSFRKRSTFHSTKTCLPLIGTKRKPTGIFRMVPCVPEYVLSWYITFTKADEFYSRLRLSWRRITGLSHDATWMILWTILTDHMTLVETAATLIKRDVGASFSFHLKLPTSMIVTFILKQLSFFSWWGEGGGRFRECWVLSFPSALCYLLAQQFWYADN